MIDNDDIPAPLNHQSYNFIFLTAMIVSIMSIAVAIARQRVTKMVIPNVV